MTRTAKAWKGGTPFIQTVRKLRELSARIHRLELAARISRTKAMLGAMAPSTEKPRG